MGGACIVNWEELDSLTGSAFRFPLEVSGEVAFLNNRNLVRSSTGGGIMKYGEKTT